MAVLSDAPARVVEAERAIRRVYEELVEPLLSEAPVWDVHTHVGCDDDGASLSAGELVEQLRSHGVRHAFTFPFRARHADYPRLNREVLAASRSSDGVLIPFCRSEPGGDFARDIAAAIASGARGIKLHPSDGVFTCAHPCVEIAFSIAADSDVPIVLHAGRALASPAVHLAQLVERHANVRVILAHCAIADMTAVAALPPGANVVVDTSVWNTTDLHAALAMLPPAQIAYGTDSPYYRSPIIQAKLALALDRLSAPSDAVEAIFGGNARRILEGGTAPDSKPALGDAGRFLSPCLRRVHDYLLMATAAIWRYEEDAVGALALARQTLRDDDRYAHAALELVTLAEALWTEETAAEGGAERLGLSLRTYRLIELADALLVGAGR